VYRSIGMNGGTSWFLPRIIGQGRALELLMTGAHMDAQQALAWGWANRVWPLAEFDERANEFLEMLAGLATIASGAFKAAVEYSSAHSLRDSLANELVVAGRMRGTEDADEGRRSFHEKRAPVFRGR
jgi:2-(1,2-epoxy-1,2-dihydrophenyl)acetyl-CoA isomerase